MIIQNANLLTEEGKWLRTDLQFNEKFQAFGDLTGSDQASQDHTGRYIVAGLVDIHTHGAMGMDISDGESCDMSVLSQYYARQGVTSWCPTTLTLQEEDIVKACENVTAFQNPTGAKTAGIYLEGPFFHYDKRGAQAPENLAKPDFAMFQRLLDKAKNQVSVLAMAPELENSLESMEKISKYCTVALGHSTSDYNTAMEGFRRGANLVTHLFNGMMPLNHREPAIIGAAYDSGAFAEIICDGLHIHPSVLRMAKSLFGKNLCLISDSLRCAGMPDGDYMLSGHPITKVGNRVTLANGTIAGSCIGLLTGVQNVISYGFTAEEAFYAGSTAPARAIKKDDTIGSLSVGKYADFLVLNQDFQLISTYVNGEKVYEVENPTSF